MYGKIAVAAPEESSVPTANGSKDSSGASPTTVLDAAWDDPVLTAVERMRAAETRLNRADEALGIRDWVREQRGLPELPEETRPGDELDREIHDALREYRAAWRELLGTRPTTLLGFSAKVFYLTEYEETEIGRALRDDVIALLQVRGA